MPVIVFASSWPRSWATSLLSLYLGRRIAGSDRDFHHLAELAIGVVVLALVRYVPVLGPETSFFVNAITLGAVLDTHFGTNRPWVPPRHTGDPGEAPLEAQTPDA